MKADLLLQKSQEIFGTGKTHVYLTNFSPYVSNQVSNQDLFTKRTGKTLTKSCAAKKKLCFPPPSYGSHSLESRLC